MLRIRLQRLGRRNRPFYRINAVDQRTRRDGRVIENLGWYDPVSQNPEKQLLLKEDRIKHWIEMGAQPSETVMDMLAKAKLVPTEAWEAERAESRKRVEAKKAAEAAAAGAEEKKA